MSRTFFTADWHLGDDRQDILGRPFASAEEMQTRIIAEHNAIVSPDDTVFVIGDALHSSGKVPPKALADFNGHLILIRGNHDVLPDDAYAPYVEAIVAEGQGIATDVGGLPCYLTHYPTQAERHLFNLVGHIHGTWRVQKNMLNVGVDAHHFRPVSEEQVLFYFKAICDFYDEDVWCASSDANEQHSHRGKPGRYLDKS